MFRWMYDEDGDLVLCICGVLYVTHYRGAALVSWSRP